MRPCMAAIWCAVLALTLTAALIAELRLAPAVMAGPSADDYVMEASALYNRKEYAKAVEFLKKALQLDPRHVRAWSWLGLTYAQMGRRTEAIAAFKKVIELAPRTKDAQAAQQWIERLQKPLLVPVRSPPGRGEALPPAYLADLRAVMGVGDYNRPWEAQLFGIVYRKALVRDLHEGEEWRAVYNLEAKYVRLRVLAGPSDSTSLKASFEVTGDHRVLYKGPPKQVGEPPERIDVDVTRVVRLELIARWVAGGGAAIWADPQVLSSGAR